MAVSFLWMSTNCDYLQHFSNTLVSVTVALCLLCGTNWISKYNSGLSELGQAVSLPLVTAGVRDRAIISLMYDLSWTVWHWEGFCFECFVFPRAESSHQCSILIFTYKLLSPQVQTGKAWEPSKKATFFRKSWNTGLKIVSFFVLHLVKRGQCINVRRKATTLKISSRHGRVAFWRLIN